MSNSIRRGLVFVLSAPAGTGKTTLVNYLLGEFSHIIQSVSFTTRPPRTGEIDGKHYHFISQAQFDQRIAQGDFLEYVSLYGYSYGTSRSQVEALQKAGKHVMLVIDTQGALKLKGVVPAVYIFVLPPSMEELKQRLEVRRTETPEAIQKRLSWALQELKMVHQYDYSLINDDRQIAYDVLRSIVIAEEHRVIH